jgi:hypothetical protein
MMKNRASGALRISVSVLFLWTALGVPLTQHICSMMGAVGPFSACEMDQPVDTDACCASDGLEDAATSSGPGITAATPGSCCSDILLAARQQDDFTSAQQQAPVFSSAVFFDSQPLSPPVPPDGIFDAFSSDTSPPLSGLYLIQSSLRI